MGMAKKYILEKEEREANKINGYNKKTINSGKYYETCSNCGNLIGEEYLQKGSWGSCPHCGFDYDAIFEKF